MINKSVFKATSKFLILAICFVLVFSVATPSFATTSASNVPINGIPAPEVKVFINGYQYAFNPVPVKYQGTVYLPVEQFAKYVNGKVTYLRDMVLISTPNFSTMVTLYRDAKSGCPLFRPSQSASLVTKWDSKNNILSISYPIRNSSATVTNSSGKVVSGNNLSNNINPTVQATGTSSSTALKAIPAPPVTVKAGKYTITISAKPARVIKQTIIIPSQQPVQDSGQQSNQQALTLKYVAMPNVGTYNTVPDSNGYLNIVIDSEMFKYIKPEKLICFIDKVQPSTPYISLEPIAITDITNYRSGDVLKIPASYGDL